jgi:hypothetical protein
MERGGKASDLPDAAQSRSVSWYDKITKIATYPGGHFGGNQWIALLEIRADT